VPFQQGSGKWLVSPGGGHWPRWRRDGKELFYMSLDNKITSAEISTLGSSPMIGKVTPLFQVSASATTLGWTYDVSADGKKFVVANEAGDRVAVPLTLVVNWPELLKKE
jgi:eukaryotic-like serine/threonine-protein kinase